MDTPLPTPWVNKYGHIQLFASGKKTQEEAPHINVLVRTREPRTWGNAVLDDRWVHIRTYPLVDDPRVTHREQARRYLAVVATLYGYPFEGRYAL